MRGRGNGCSGSTHGEISYWVDEVDVSALTDSPTQELLQVLHIAVDTRLQGQDITSVVSRSELGPERIVDARLLHLAHGPALGVGHASKVPGHPQCQLVHFSHISLAWELSRASNAQIRRLQINKVPSAPHQSSLFHVPEVAPACRATSGSPVATSLGPIRTTGPYFLNKSRCIYACLLLPAVMAIHMSVTCQRLVSNQSFHVVFPSKTTASNYACLVSEKNKRFKAIYEGHWHGSMPVYVWKLTGE